MKKIIQEGNTITIMQKICKYCKYFDGASGCNSDKFVYVGVFEDAEMSEDGLGYWDYESYAAGFNVGERFGCIHWEEKVE